LASLFEKEGITDPNNVEIDRCNWQKIKTYEKIKNKITISVEKVFFRSFSYLNKKELKN